MAQSTRAGTYLPSESHGAGGDRVVRRVSWGAIIAGTVTVLAILMLLGLLGVWIGLATVDPAAADTPTAQSFGIGAAIWSVITVLIAVFVGGVVASRLTGVPAAVDGMLQGWLTWALATIVVIFLASTAVSSVLGGVFGALGNVAQATAQGAQSAASAAASGAQSTNLDPSQLPAPLQNVVSQAEDRLRAIAQQNGINLPQGQQELTSLMQNLATAAMQGDTQQIQQILVQRTGVTPQQAQGAVQQIQTEFQQTMQQAQQQATEAAQVAAESTSQAAMFAFIALLLGAVAGVVGGWLGTPRDPWV